MCPSVERPYYCSTTIPVGNSTVSGTNVKSDDEFAARPIIW